jgi:hypothetical protein
MIFSPESWPDENETMENSLRAALVEIGTINSSEARQHLEKLEATHGVRSWMGVGAIGYESTGECPEASAALPSGQR